MICEDNLLGDDESEKWQYLENDQETDGDDELRRKISDQEQWNGAAQEAAA